MVVPNVVLEIPSGQSQWRKWFLFFLGAVMFPRESDFIMLFQGDRNKLCEIQPSILCSMKVKLCFPHT
jgi:hypothetical protein